MVRFNKLKILISAGEAKPGGQIGAMLSPYLFSTNMLEFCKKFNELTKDYNIGIVLPVKIFCDIFDKSYSFFIKMPYIGFLYNHIRIREYKVNGFISLGFLYDLVQFFVKITGLKLYDASKILFGVYTSYKRRRVRLNLSKNIKLKVNSELY